MSRNVVETILGAVVLLVAVGFGAWAYGRSNVEGADGYQLVARFDRVDGLEIGGDVRVSGIRVGRIEAQELDTQTYRALVRFSVRDGIELPEDSSAAIVSTGLLGGRYLAVVPGGADELLREGGEVKLTQSAINIEDLIGRFIYGQGSGSGGSGGGGQAPAPPAAAPAADPFGAPAAAPAPAPTPGG